MRKIVDERNLPLMRDIEIRRSVTKLEIVWIFRRLSGNRAKRTARVDVHDFRECVIGEDRQAARRSFGDLHLQTVIASVRNRGAERLITKIYLVITTIGGDWYRIVADSILEVTSCAK